MTTLNTPASYPRLQIHQPHTQALKMADKKSLDSTVYTCAN